MKTTSFVNGVTKFVILLEALAILFIIALVFKLLVG